MQKQINNMESTKDIFRLPTKEEWDNLVTNHSVWNSTSNMLEITVDDNTLVLPAEYSRGKDKYGKYWAAFESDKLHTLFFDEDLLELNEFSIDERNDLGKHSIRLVSDTPFEGGIEVGNIYWKPENEEGYFTYDEVILMRLFKNLKLNNMKGLVDFIKSKCSQEEISELVNDGPKSWEEEW